MVQPPPPIHQHVAQDIVNLIDRLDKWALPAWGATLAAALPEAAMPDGAKQKGGAKMRVSTDKHKGWLVIRLMADGTYRVEIGHADEGPKPRWTRLKGMDDIKPEELVHFIDYLI